MRVKLIIRSTQFLVLWGILSIVLVGCSVSPFPAASTNNTTFILTPGTYWPIKAWRTSPPEEQGMDSQKLAHTLEVVQQQRLNLHSLLIIRNGYIVSETYFGPDKQNTRREIYSSTKSFVSTLIGIAIDKGYIDSVDHRIVDFFSKRTFANLDGQKDDMTLEDVLTMRSGLEWQEGDLAYQALYQSSDWVKFMLDKPMAQPPGRLFNYCSGCSHLLSAILQQTTGMKTRDFAEQYLFKPLGISNVKWETDTTGIPIGGWGLQLAPREMAKLGYLFLQDGQWDGQQIVSAKWVDAATQKHAENPDNGLGYGYQWWMFPSLGGYAALGRGGQNIFVIPGSDLVIVTTATDFDSIDAVEQLIERVISAVQRSP